MLQAQSALYPISKLNSCKNLPVGTGTLNSFPSGPISVRNCKRLAGGTAVVGCVVEGLVGGVVIGCVVEGVAG